MNNRIHKRLELTQVDGKEGVYRIHLFDPLELFMEKYENTNLPYDRDGYVRIFGDGLRELYFPVVELTTIDLVFFTKAVLSEWSSGLKLIHKN